LDKTIHRAKLYNSVFDAKKGGINLFIAICRLKIKPVFGLFDGLSFDCMRINHGGSDITVTQQFLNCADIIVGLQQVAGKTVPESMGGCAFRDFSLPYCPFDCFLDMGFMEIIPSVFLYFRQRNRAIFFTLAVVDG